MALKRMKWEIEEKQLSQVQEALNLEKEIIIERYEQGASITSIANALNEAYQPSFTSIMSYNPSKGKKTKQRPTIRFSHVKSFLKKENIIK